MANLIGLSAATDIANAALKFYVKKGGLSQTTQDKPLLAKLTEKQKMFPGGNTVISLPIQGTFMSDSVNLQGFTEDELIEFNRVQNLLRAEYNWYEVALGLITTGTELKKDGISLVDDNGKTSQHSGATETRLTSILKNRIEDFGESYSRLKNKMLWADGSADSQHIPGVLALLTDDPNTGTTGGIDRATNTWWRHRARVGGLAVTTNTGPKITHSPTNQTLTKTLRSELIQLRRYGGRADFAPCGSGFLEKLRAEVSEKGYYTQNNFNQKSATQVGMQSVMLDNLEFIYDPTLDDLGRSNFCYLIDTRRLRLMPMEQEDDRVHHPTKPYNALVFLQMLTFTGGLVIDQLNSCGVYEAA